MPTPRTLEELRTWLGRLPPADRVHLVRLLANTRTIGELAAIGDATIYELTRTTPPAEVAAELGLTARQVKRAIEQYYARARRTA